MASVPTFQSNGSLSAVMNGKHRMLLSTGSKGYRPLLPAAEL